MERLLGGVMFCSVVKRLGCGDRAVSLRLRASGRGSSGTEYAEVFSSVGQE